MGFLQLRQDTRLQRDFWRWVEHQQHKRECEDALRESFDSDYTAQRQQSAEWTCGDERRKGARNLTDLRRVAIEEDRRLVPPMASLGIGAVAGAISALITNPLDVLTTRRMIFGRGKPLFPDVNTSFYLPENIAGPLTVREKLARTWHNRVVTMLFQ